MADFNNTIFGELKIVDPPIRVLSFGPVKDSMLVESQPLLDYGEYNSIQISDGSDGKYAGIFGFAPLAVTASQWSALKRVKLILTTNGYHPDPSQVAIYVVRDDTWTEYGINWGNQPVHEEVPITGYEVEANAGTITFDLTDYFKNFGDITGKSFNFYVKSDVKTERPLSVCSKEYSVAENRPKLTVSYYDYQLVPILSSINSDINVVACARSEIECDLTVQSNFVSADISCDITVPKFALTPAEIVCDLSVEQRVLAEIVCDLLVEKQVLLPADIDCDITVLRTLPAVDIACDLTVEKQTIQSEITADIIAAAVLTPVDVECTVLVEKQAINGDLPADISVSVKTTPVDIECTATVEKQLAQRDSTVPPSAYEKTDKTVVVAQPDNKDAPVAIYKINTYRNWEFGTGVGYQDGSTYIPVSLQRNYDKQHSVMAEAHFDVEKKEINGGELQWKVHF